MAAREAAAAARCVVGGRVVLSLLLCGGVRGVMCAPASWGG